MHETKTVPVPAAETSKASQNISTQKRKWWRSQLVLGTTGIIIALLAGSLGTYYAVRPSGSPEADQVAKIVAELSKLIVLPTNETPTLATVSDPEKLRDQAFFANAQKGFKVIVYSRAGKAILYDPFQKKIVEVAPVNLGNLGK